MSVFFKTLLHAAIGGFAAGFAAAGAGASLKISLLAGGTSALTSIISLFSTAPKVTQ